MRNAFYSMFLLVILLLAGCSQANKENANVNTTKSKSELEETQQWDLSSEFETSTGDKLVGQKDIVGIVGPEFKAGETNKWLWHFWGDEKTIKDGNFKVVAVNKETGKKEKVLVSEVGKVWNYGTLGYAPIRGSYSSIPSSMSLPTPGIWRLEVFIGSERFGAIVVDVK